MDKRCSTCVGSGEIMGGGMMMMDCPNCYGAGKILSIHSKVDKVESVPVDKRSKGYKEAINKIMELQEISRDDAVAVFDEEYNKL